MFEKTLKAFNECKFDFTYNARYSVRKWTIASKIYPDDISNEIKAERWHKLNDTLLKNVKSRNKLMLNREEEVLISWEKDWIFFWRTRNFKEVHFPKKEWINIWDIIKVKIIKLQKYILLWEII
jgi:tRNA-2-methylthio-N6-dimethylallyladenosine synthase